jgi:hypothetical protein
MAPGPNHRSALRRTPRRQHTQIRAPQPPPNPSRVRHCGPPSQWRSPRARGSTDKDRLAAGLHQTSCRAASEPNAAIAPGSCVGHTKSRPARPRTLVEDQTRTNLFADSSTLHAAERLAETQAVTPRDDQLLPKADTHPKSKRAAFLRLPFTFLKHHPRWF